MKNKNGKQITEDRIDPEDLGLPRKVGTLKIKPIKWSLFQKQALKGQKNIAQLHWLSSYNIPFHFSKPYQVEVSCKILKRSWIIQSLKNKELLEHEYLHYILACIGVLQFQKLANDFGKKCSSYEQFQQFCAVQFEKHRAKNMLRQKAYDQETKHYENKQEQVQWKWELIAKLRDLARDFRQENLCMCI